MNAIRQLYLNELIRRTGYHPAASRSYNPAYPHASYDTAQMAGPRQAPYNPHPQPERPVAPDLSVIPPQQVPESQMPQVRQTRSPNSFPVKQPTARLPSGSISSIRLPDAENTTPIGQETSMNDYLSEMNALNNPRIREIRKKQREGWARRNPQTSSVPKQGYLSGASDAFGDGLMGGFNDNFSALKNAIVGRKPGTGILDWGHYDRPILERYISALEAERKLNEQYKKDNPLTAKFAFEAGNKLPLVAAGTAGLPYALSHPARALIVGGLGTAAWNGITEAGRANGKNVGQAFLEGSGAQAIGDLYNYFLGDNGNDGGKGGGKSSGKRFR